MNRIKFILKLIMYILLLGLIGFLVFIDFLFAIDPYSSTYDRIWSILTFWPILAFLVIGYWMSVKEIYRNA